MFGEKKVTRSDVDHLTFKVVEIDKTVRGMPTEVDFINLIHKIRRIEEKVDELELAHKSSAALSYDTRTEHRAK